MKVLLASAECSPLARTGGLGEAVAGLGHALRRAGHEVAVAIPRYRHLSDVGEPGPGLAYARSIVRHETDGLTVLLVDDPPAFDRPGIYGPEPGTGYDDQWWRFGRFSVTVRALAADYDLLHLHDAHVGPAALDAPAPTVFTIHNAAYSVFGPLSETAELVGARIEHVVPAGPLEWYGAAHFLKVGVTLARRVTTVSPSFARQLLDDPSVSHGLDGVLRSLPHPIVGILNGIDVERWDPRRDPALPQTFSPGRLGRREASREALLDRFGLDEGFVVGNVGRMSTQKGLGLLDPEMDRLVTEGLRFVFVGNGELDPMVDGWAERHPRAVSHSPFDEDLARLVYAGADTYLMPSFFEPCGIGQMYAMAYGCPPSVRLTGGLADTVVDLDEDPDDATGFGFRLTEPVELAKTLRRARRVHDRERAEWRRLQRRGMTRDWSWDRAAVHYLDVYEAART